MITKKIILAVPIIVKSRHCLGYLVLPEGADQTTIKQLYDKLVASTDAPEKSLHPDKDGYDPLWSRYYC